ncbi:MAG: TIGR03087 family PEP-CTERM/XrtA system glycosyltransferase [bacterium]
MRLLFVSQRVPEPPNKGDKIRSHHMMRRIASRHEVHLAFLLDGPEEAEHVESVRGWAASVHWRTRGTAESAARGALAALRGRPISAGWFWNSHLADEVRALWRTPFDAAIAYCTSMTPYLEEFAGPRVLDLVDVDSEKWKQYAARSSFPRRDVYTLEHRLLRSWEKALVRRFDRSLVVSRAERDLLGTFADVSRVRVVGNGVDADGFHRPGPRGTEPILVFVGALDYFANVEGIVRFTREILPLVRERVAGCRLRVVGRKPVAEVRALAAVEGVEVIADPEDVRPPLWGAAVAVAPLWIAQGTQNKVLEAMAARVPVVATTAAVQGIDGQADRHFRIADAPEEWARAVSDLVTRPEEADALAERARQLVLERYSWDRQAERYEAEILAATEAGRGAPGRRP